MEPTKEWEQTQQQCPLCGETSFLGLPHKECMDYEQYIKDMRDKADAQEVE